jgi:hypothetical protein
LNDPPAESEANDKEAVVTAPIITASPKTPLVIVTKDEDGKKEVSINPAPEVATEEAPASVEPAASPSRTISGKKADPTEPALVAPAPKAADPEVTAAKTVTATPDADIKKIRRSVAKADDAANSANDDEKAAVEVKKQASVAKVVKKVENVAQEAVKDVEKILKETELAVEKAKPLLPNKCFYI